MSADPAITSKIIHYANQFNIDPALFMAVIQQESDFIVNSSDAEPNGDYSIGLTRIESQTAISMGYQSTGDLMTDVSTLEDPDLNLYYGARYLRSRMDTYSNLPLVNQIMCYNSGSPLDESSPYYSNNIQYGTNVMNYYSNWMNIFKFSDKADYTKEIILSVFLGGLAIYVDNKFNK